MGQTLAKLFERLSEFPLKRDPICFYPQGYFTSTGDRKTPNVSDDLSFQQQLIPHDENERHFVETLRDLNEDYNSGCEQLHTKFPGWNSLVIANLRHMFILLTIENDFRMNLQQFCLFLDSVGEDSLRNVRQEKFNNIATTGWLTFQKFLNLIYYYQPMDENEELEGIAKTCADIADKIQFVHSLPIPEQIKHGLF